MKKLFCLLLAFCALHTIIAQDWEQETLKNRWGDDSGIMYCQVHEGTDSKNTYRCDFGFIVDDKLVFIFGSKIAGDFAIHPGYDIFDGKDVTIRFRKDGAIQTFSGVTLKNDSSGWLDTAFVGVAAASIAKLLKGNGTWDVLVEGRNWYVRTKVHGNLPLSLDEKDVLILSADGKTVTGVKSWCKNLLENVVIPNGVTSIGEFAFMGCKNLKTVTLPDSVTEIGKVAFSGCTSLQTIKIPDSVTEIGDYAFSDCRALREVSLSKRLTKISEWAFLWCSSLQTIKIPDSVTEIGDSAFQSCRALREVSLPNRLTKIGKWAFAGCTSLQTIKIPDSVTEIGNYAFDSCIALREVSLPAKIEAINFGSVFMNCDNLKSITVPKSVKLTNVPRTVQVIRN